MAGQAAVTSSAVQGGIRCCTVSIQELENAIRKLLKNYQAAGAQGWRDQKYTELGQLVQECCRAMKQPTGELQECMNKLEEILAVIKRYEETNL